MSCVRGGSGVSSGGAAGGATELTQEDIRDLLQTFVALAVSMKALMPRLDVAGRAVVAGNEVTQPVSGTVTATVTNATVSNITSISGYSYANQMFYPPLHIYSAIQVTP